MPVVRSTPRRAWALLAATFSLAGAIGTNAAAQESPDSTAHVVTPRSPLAVLGARTVTIYPDSFPDAPRSLTALLAMAVPEVFVQRASGATAAGAWLSMRDGAAARGEQPLVVVDGIKTVAAVPRVAQAAERRAPSRLDEIPVEDVERIDILAGPAAAARYGREARAGVIEITTRRPGAGAPRVRASISGGANASGDDFPRNSTRIGSDNTVCTWGETRTPCSAATSSRYTPLLDASPFRTAASPQGHLGVSGGLAGAGYSVDLSRATAAGALASDATDLSTAAARIAMPVARVGRLELTSRWAFRGATTPFEGGMSIVAAGLRGYYDCTPATPCRTGDSLSRGYGSDVPPEQLARRAMKHRVQHFTNGATFTAEPLAWLSLRSLASVDAFADRGGFSFEYPVSWATNGFYGVRNVRRERAVRDVLGQDVVARRALGSYDLSTTLSVRGDHERGRMRAMEHQGDNSVYSEWGVWGEGAIRRQTITLAPRLSNPRGSLGLSAVSTRTRMSGYGAKTPATRDGTADASFVVAAGGESDWLRSLVVRGAMGQVTTYPAGEDVVRGTYLFFGGYMDADGNLRPDRTYEGEGGLDLAIAPADGRLSLTAYRRRESHRRPYLVGYTGFLVPLPAVRRVVNGLELDGRIVPVAKSGVRLETKLGFTLQADRVRSETSGPLGLIVDQYDFLSRLSMLQGRSFSSWISTPYTYADTNRDGRLDVLTGAAPSVVGRSRPSRFGTFDTRLTLAQHWTLAANLGYVGGHKVLDKVESIRCRVRICAAAQGASLADQAHVQMMGGPEYFVPGDALRVHELSLAYGAPGLARLTRAGGVRVTIAARNLATFSHARYLDPETELPLPGIEGDVVQDPGLALQRTLVIRLTATY